MNDTPTGKSREWLHSAIVVGSIIFGVGSWTGVLKNGIEQLETRMEAQDQQLRNLRSIVSSQLIDLAVMKEQMKTMKEQLDSVSRAVGARVVQ